MDTSASARPVRKHLTPPRAIARAIAEVAAPGTSGAHRSRGNGVRVHAIWFAALSLVGLVLVLTAAALASAR